MGVARLARIIILGGLVLGEFSCTLGQKPGDDGGGNSVGGGAKGLSIT